VAEAERVILLPIGIAGRRTQARSLIALAVLGCALASTNSALAQDVPGIENCMAEKQIERRTGCLQSNINFLKTQITTEVGKAKADAQAKLDDAAKQVDALKLLVSGLQAELKQVQADLADARAKLSKPPAK
jgi:septal ring factor EnvC (AmiA/AmiB activator)